ncbi:hypothetical protein HAX54_009814, partial [Datura stramonium]|nr:hypothetical protein [Datura stramonium]
MERACVPHKPMHHTKRSNAPGKILEAQRSEATRLAKETRLAEIGRRVEATNFVAALAERTQQKPLVIMN